MLQQKGFSQVLIIALVLIVVLTVVIYPKSQPNQQQEHQQTSRNQQDSKQNSRVFFEKDGLSFEQYWLRDFYAPHMKADETEIQIYNEGSKTVGFKSIKVEYFVDGVKLVEKSGTWEKFPSRTSWEKTQYVNISPAYYKGESLILNPGEKGKIHHHIEAGKDIPSAKDQKVQINLVYTLDDEEVTLEKELVRTTPPASGGQEVEGH